MTKEEIEKHISSLQDEKTKLIKVKSASPKEIMDRTAKLNRRIENLQAKLKETK